MQRRISVIGGGLAGLTAAAFAARGGADVRVYEAREHVGGRARSRVRDGIVFNQGPHALNPRRGAVDVLAELGIRATGTQPSAGGAYGRLRGAYGLLPGTPIDAVRTRLVGLRTKAQLARLLARPASALRTPTAGLSLQEWIDARVRDRDARALVGMIGRVSTYVDDLTTIDAAAGVRQTVAALTDGVVYLDGGWQRLVDGLRVAAEEAGAKIVTDRKVEALDDVDASDAFVVAAGGPRHVASLLGGASRRVEGWAATASPVLAASLELALARLPVPSRRVCLGVDDPLYFSVHTPAALAPPGVEVVHVMRYGDPPDDPRSELEAFVDEVQPGWRSEGIDEQYGRRLVVSQDRPRPRVDPAERPSVVVDDLDGVFVAGDWAGPAGLLADAAVASGRAAAEAALVS